jgi:hypothetical protein
MTRVKVYRGNGPPARTGVGLFAAALLARLPQLPVEEEGRLQDPRLRENFIERVFAYRRLRDLFESRWTVGHLVRYIIRNVRKIRYDAEPRALDKSEIVADSVRSVAVARFGRLLRQTKRAQRQAQVGFACIREPQEIAWVASVPRLQGRS